MKNRFVLIILSAIILSSCSVNDGKSDAYGNFEAKEIIISSEAQGKIIEMNFEEGSVIKKDELVIVVDSMQLYLKKQQLIASKKTVSTKISNIISQINVGEEQKKTLIIEKERVNNLLKDGAATGKQLDDINGKIDVIDKQIASIRTQNSTVLSELEVFSKQIDMLNDQLSKYSVVNPVNGTVLEKYVEIFEIAIPGKPLYKIADLNEMELKVYITGEQLPYLKLNQKVEVFIDDNKNSNKKLEGDISWISSEAEFTPKIIQTKEERVKLVYAVKVRVKNDGRIKIGMPGEINFMIK